MRRLLAFSLFFVCLSLTNLQIRAAPSKFLLSIKNGKSLAESNEREGPEKEYPWWKTSIIYQIYPRSFKDSDADGVGDLKGILSKLDYLEELGVGAVWLSPVYVSPMADFGYDIANYKDIDPIFGTLEDFDQLLSELHSRGIKLLMDFVPNHSSDQHEWFIKSLKKMEPYTDYYVWLDPKGFDEDGKPIPPNNWLSVFGYSAWEWSDERQQFYLHKFVKEQPDLNVRNPAVMEELDNVVKFWLDRGVDGIRVDAIQQLFEVEDMSLDEPVDEEAAIEDPNQHEYLKHIYTSNQPETVEAVRRWRKILDEYDDRFMIVEIYDADPSIIMEYYGHGEDKIAHFPFNFYLISDLHNRSSVTGEKLKMIIDRWMDNMPERRWPNWVLGNHDRDRLATRLGKDIIDSMNMMLLLLKGTPTTYYGEEIGMEDTEISFEDAIDPWGLNFGPEKYSEFGRDFERTPMQWDNSQNAGFSTGNETWLPVNENYETINVAAESDAQQSHLKVYKNLADLRKKKTFTHGEFSYSVSNEEVLAFVRHLQGEETYLVVINTSNDELELNLKEQSSYDLPDTGTIEIRSSFDKREQTEEGLTVSLDSISLLPGEGLVIKISG